MLKEALKKAMALQHLSEQDMFDAVMSLIQGHADPVQMGALLVALRMKGESPEEIAGAAKAVRTGMVRVRAPEGCVVDTCGTGGDGAGSFNISTAVACVVAACGITVAKHGNRAVSSRSGSADVLEAMGIGLHADVALLEDMLRTHRIAFLFAPHLNTAMRAAAPVRGALGVRTLFNVLGPLANPAGATHQLLGVFHRSLLLPMAHALHALGTQAALVVHGHDGTDELSLCGASDVAVLRDGHVTTHTWSPEDVGLKRCEPNDLKGGTPQQNAHTMQTLLKGGCLHTPVSDAVAYNAAAVLWLVNPNQTLSDAVRLAQETLQSGAAWRILEALQQRFL